jgi:hypothetical protein
MTCGWPTPRLGHIWSQTFSQFNQSLAVTALAALALAIRPAATGPAKVTIVNPDQDAARRIEAVAGPDIKRIWVPKRIQEWLQDERSRER